MAKRDVYHETVRCALEADGWTITQDPLTLRFGEQNVYVDLGAESPLTAEKAGRKIAVEVKSFLGTSAISDMERALGQYSLYSFLIRRREPERDLYLAVPQEAYKALFTTADGRDLLTETAVALIVFDISTERIVQWIE